MRIRLYAAASTTGRRARHSTPDFPHRRASSGNRRRFRDADSRRQAAGLQAKARSPQHREPVQLAGGAEGARHQQPVARAGSGAAIALGCRNSAPSAMRCVAGSSVRADDRKQLAGCRLVDGAPLLGRGRVPTGHSSSMNSERAPAIPLQLSWSRKITSAIDPVGSRRSCGCGWE